MGRPQNDVSLISERRIMFSLLDFFHLLHSLYWLICLPSHKGFHRLGVLLHLEGLCRLDRTAARARQTAWVSDAVAPLRATPDLRRQARALTASKRRTANCGLPCLQAA